MYTSVHYVVSSKSRTKVTCEIQVRTLMEEVWGSTTRLTIHIKARVFPAASKYVHWPDKHQALRAWLMRFLRP